MKKIFLVSALFLVACSSDNSPSKKVTQEGRPNINKPEVKRELFTEKGKELLRFVIEDELKTLSDGGEVQITEYLPVYTAEKITKDYGQNEVRANTVYKNKQFFITGTIGSIEAGIDDKPIVHLKTNTNYGFNSPLLKFNKIDHGKIIDLNKGQKVTFLCNGKSEITGTPILENCLFTDTLESKIMQDVLTFQDKDLLGNNREYNQAVFTYLVSVLILGKVSNDFEKCTEFSNKCVENILKNTSKEDIQKVSNEVKAQFPKANESLKNN